MFTAALSQQSKVQKQSECSQCFMIECCQHIHTQNLSHIPDETLPSDQRPSPSMLPYLFLDDVHTPWIAWPFLTWLVSILLCRYSSFLPHVLYSDLSDLLAPSYVTVSLALVLLGTPCPLHRVGFVSQIAPGVSRYSAHWPSIRSFIRADLQLYQSINFLLLKFYISITVYIQHYFILLSGVQHSGQTIIFYKVLPRYFKFPPGTKRGYYNIVDCIPQAVFHIPVTVL